MDRLRAALLAVLLLVPLAAGVAGAAPVARSGAAAAGCGMSCCRRNAPSPMCVTARHPSCSSLPVSLAAGGQQQRVVAPAATVLPLPSTADLRVASVAVSPLAGLAAPPEQPPRL